MKMQFSENIRKLRTERGFTQTKLAKILGVNKSIISAYENQERMPSLNMLIKLSATFGISMEELLGVVKTTYPDAGKNKTVDVSGLTKEQAALVLELVNQFDKSNRSQNLI